MALPGLTRAEAIHTREFWFLLIALFLTAGSLIGTTAHSVPMLAERGLGLVLATTAVSCFFFGGVLGQLTSGFISDRINSSRIVAPYFLAGLIGAMFVHTAKNSALMLCSAVIMGMGQGGRNCFLSLFDIALLWSARLWEYLLLLLCRK
jgi:nitrate/nitrite transporter NarK